MSGKSKKIVRGEEPEENLILPVQKIVPNDIAKEMKRSYLDYAMSVIVSPPLPHVPYVL